MNGVIHEIRLGVNTVKPALEGPCFVQKYRVSSKIISATQGCVVVNQDINH
jgi:hypothetical protein